MPKDTKEIAKTTAAAPAPTLAVEMPTVAASDSFEFKISPSIVALPNIAVAKPDISILPDSIQILLAPTYKISSYTPDDDAGELKRSIDAKSVPCLPDIHPDDQYKLDVVLSNHYHAHILNALITTTIGTTHEIYGLPTRSETSAMSESKYGYSPKYVRDPLFMIVDEKTFLFSEDKIFETGKYRANCMLHALSYLNYKHEFIENALLDGGNCFYLPSKRTFLFGMMHGENYFDTRKNLSAVLRKYNIKLEILSTSKLPITLLANFYYHLDCYLQILPDGRAIILNREILSPSSNIILQEILGEENIIDLKYSKYMSPDFILNFIVGGTSPNYTLLCPKMPEEYVEQLQRLGFKVIDPDTISSDSLRTGNTKFDIDIASSVVEILQTKGFEGATVANLTYYLPKNVKGYYVDSNTFFHPDVYHYLMSQKKNFPYSGHPLTFILDTSPTYEEASTDIFGGGPHCRTLELPAAPPKTMIATVSEKRIASVSEMCTISTDSAIISALVSSSASFSATNPAELSSSSSSSSSALGSDMASTESKMVSALASSSSAAFYATKPAGLLSSSSSSYLSSSSIVSESSRYISARASEAAAPPTRLPS